MDGDPFGSADRCKCEHCFSETSYFDIFAGDRLAVLVVVLAWNFNVNFRVVKVIVFQIR